MVRIYYGVITFIRPTSTTTLLAPQQHINRATRLLDDTLDKHAKQAQHRIVHLVDNPRRRFGRRAEKWCA